jgi:arylsulfatase A-like enzyme
MDSKKPNILWICTDHQRSDTLGCYGNSYVRTPNLDALAANGVKFDLAYSQSPVCTPSRAAFLTGRYPRTTRARQNGQMIPAGEVLVSRIFRDNGYNCGLAGKLHLAPCNTSVCRTTEQRIDDGYDVLHWSHHPQDFNNPKGGWANNEYHVWLRRNGQEYKPAPFRGSKHVRTGIPEEYHQTTWCVDRAIDFMQANTIHQNPWFFSVNMYDPHDPFDPPAEYLERYLDILDELPLPNFVPGEIENKPLFQRREHKNGGYNQNKTFCYENMTDYDHRLIKAAFYAMIDLIDKQTGRLVEALKETGQLENTIIIFTSDHGDMLGDHGIYMKGPHFYDCAVKVPLIISWEGQFKKNTGSGALVELIDIAPTILDAAGIPVYEGMQGKSLYGLLRGESDSGYHRENVMSEYMNAMPTHDNPKAFVTMLRDKRYKLVCHHGQDDGELYDMVADPNETYNLWLSAEHESIKNKMIQTLCDRIAFSCDPLPIRQAGY